RLRVCSPRGYFANAPAPGRRGRRSDPVDTRGAARATRAAARSAVPRGGAASRARAAGSHGEPCRRGGAHEPGPKRVLFAREPAGALPRRGRSVWSRADGAPGGRPAFGYPALVTPCTASGRERVRAALGEQLV